MSTTIRPLRGFLRAVSLAGAAVLVLLLAPGAVLADCMAPPPLAEAVKNAEVVFVGTVTGVADQGRQANVQVEEVWKGRDLAVSTIVLGGQGDGFTSVDRTYEVGTKYLFFPYVDEASGALLDNLCTNTAPWQDDFTAVRPADAREPLGAEGGSGNEDAFDVASLLPAGLVVLVVVGVLVVAGLAVRGREA